MQTVNDIRAQFKFKLLHKDFIEDKSGVKLLEIPFAQFVADERFIFGTINNEWNVRELEWYDSQSLSVYDIKGNIPAVWKQVASNSGIINSNYGYLVYSKENCSQYDSVLAELKRQPTSRRAIMIYTRPSIQQEYNIDGMSDFICTNNVQYLIRNGRLHAYVNMRSNDAIYGYKGDWFWQSIILNRLAGDLEAGMLATYLSHKNED